jgi:5'-methylthioadenosine phosphorylase
MAQERVIGIIGGSGLYEIEGLSSVERVAVDTPFGKPSDEYLIGRLDGAKLVFLPRHGRGHRIPPHEINFRANVHGMKQLGVEWILSMSAVGSMKEEIRPGDLVVVDQFYDNTRRRVSSFFGDGVAGHVAFADPVCPILRNNLLTAANAAAAAAGTGVKVHDRGVYLVIDGPQFSTRGESFIYRKWGVDVIGMTNMPEAKLAREAEICYATLALSTDYDCWHESEEDVTVDAVLAVMRRNVVLAKEAVRQIVPLIDAPRGCACREAARGAVMTDKTTIPAQTRKNLDLIIGRYL